VLQKYSKRLCRGISSAITSRI